VHKVFQSWKQGIINTDQHSVLKKGQMVQIISEDENEFIVKPYIASIPQKIKKEDLVIN
jgi:hypothetical protein